MSKSFISDLFKPKKRNGLRLKPVNATGGIGSEEARLVRYKDRFIVLDKNDRPLTQWYDADTFSYTVDTAKSVQRMAKAAGRDLDPAVAVIANYSPSHQTA